MQICIFASAYAEKDLERQVFNMEKKVPERKVSLHDGDVFYVYDKRINRCIKEDCNGTVKYGLILRVNMANDEICNCFECNKCHMKYTPYPNYVRLTDVSALNIYNQSEVTARDEKRAEDARKQVLREQKEKELKERKLRFEKKDGAKKYGKVFVSKGNASSKGSDGRYKRDDKKKPYGKKYGTYKPRTNNYSNSYKTNRDHQD